MRLSKTTTNGLKYQIVDVHIAEGSFTENAKLFSKGEQTRAKHGLTWTPTNWQPASGIDRLSIR